MTISGMAPCSLTYSFVTRRTRLNLAKSLSAPAGDEKIRSGGMARVLIGTSGWHYDSWRGPFYPKGAMLKGLLRQSQVLAMPSNSSKPWVCSRIKSQNAGPADRNDVVGQASGQRPHGTPPAGGGIVALNVEIGVKPWPSRIFRTVCPARSF